VLREVAGGLSLAQYRAPFRIIRIRVLHECPYRTGRYYVIDSISMH